MLDRQIDTAAQPIPPEAHEPDVVAPLRTSKFRRTCAAFGLAIAGGGILGGIMGAGTDASGEYAGIPYQAHYNLIGSHEHYVGIGPNNGITTDAYPILPFGGASISVGMPDNFDGLSSRKNIPGNTQDTLPIVASLLSYPEAAAQDIAHNMLQNIFVGAGTGATIGALCMSGYCYRRRTEREQQPLHAAKAILGIGALAAISHAGVVAWNSPHYSEGTPIYELRDTVFADTRVHGIAFQSAVERVIPSARRVKDQIEAFSNTSSANVTAALEQTPLPEPDKNEITAFHISDIHNNLGLMKAYNTFISQADPDLIMNTGDQAIGLDGLETWAVDIFQSNALRGIKKPHLFTPGNHDADATIRQANKKGWVVLDPQKPYVYEGVAFVGATDPRYDRFGHDTALRGDTTEEMASQEITSKACELSEDDKPVVVMGHEPYMARPALEAGCSSFAAVGHLHARTTETVGDGMLSTQGTSGGAKQTINLLTPQIDADSTLYYINKKSGKVTRYYDLTITTKGAVSVTENILEAPLDPTLPIGPRPPYQ